MNMGGSFLTVEEPCQLGCSGLSYCTNFNNRPTEHFRSCTIEADQAASNDILLWQKGTIQLPNLNIPVKGLYPRLFYQLHTVMSEIFSRVLFSRNFVETKFCTQKNPCDTAKSHAHLLM